jgi:hypothetical protein
MDALAILDADTRCLISRTYTHDFVPFDEVIAQFKGLRETGDETPVMNHDGIHYAYIKNNDLILLSVMYYEHTNVMTAFSFLYKFNDILISYFKTEKLNKDLVIDNFNLIYELFDEIMDYGVPQLTDTQILKDVIKLEVQENEEDDLVNSSILKTTTNSVSWRPRGLFYKKNELFVDVVEKISLCVDANSRVVRHSIHGSIDVKCYLSGMPTLRLGLNKLINTENNKFFKKLKFHQCVELPKFATDKIISFVPPDGEFQLCHYSLNIKSTPIIEVTEHEFTVMDDKLRTKITIRTNFKLRASLAKLVVKIPIDLSEYDVDFEIVPKFKTKIGRVAYKFDEDCILWNVGSIGGERNYTMMSLFQLKRPKTPEPLGMDPPPRVTHPRFDKIKQIVDDESEKIHSYEIKVEFELPDIAFSSLKVEYLKITDDILEYTSFPWVRYKTINDEYVYRLQ